MGPRTPACSPRPAHPHRPGVVHLPAHGLVAQLLHQVELLLRGSGGGDDDDDDCPGPWLRPRRVTSSSAVRQPLPGWVGSGRVGGGAAGPGQCAARPEAQRPEPVASRCPRRPVRSPCLARLSCLVPPRSTRASVSFRSAISCSRDI